MTRRPISLDNLDRMGIDPDTRRLFWDGKEVMTTISLPWWALVAAVITATATTVIAVATLLPLFLT